MPGKSRRIIYYLALIPFIIILYLFGWLLMFSFEGEKPQISFQDLPLFLSKSQKFTLNIGDKKRGLKRLKVSVSQEGREKTLFEEKFPFKGLLNGQGIHRYEKELVIDPLALNLAQGRVDLNVHVWDYSRRGGGDGNLTLADRKMIVDTTVQIYNPFLTIFAAGLGIRVVTMGRLVALRGLMGLTAPILGGFADRIGYRRVVRVSLLLIGVGMLLAAVSRSVLPFAVAMILAGVGQVGHTPNWHAYLSARLPYEKRAAGLGIR